jgi:uncharacterized protein (DUF1786 family)
MQVLTVDIGTGTQDIYLFQEGLSLENGFKLVMPSPTMIMRERIREVTRRGEAILLTGVTMGGGPCHWAAEDHLRAGYSLYATPEAAQTFNDDLQLVQEEMGVTIVSEDEAAHLKSVSQIDLRDFDFEVISRSFAAFGVRLNPQAVGVGVFDHGAAPPDVSDRQFRFDYLQTRIETHNKLTAFAYLSDAVPPIMTRMGAVARSAPTLDCPLLIMDNAPAAILGATFDPVVASLETSLITNIGNFHALAFRIGPSGIEAVFEHHTGLINQSRLETLLLALAEGSLTHDEIFDEHGHGAIVFHSESLPVDDGFRPIVTGPRRSMMQGSDLQPYFAVPFGDMMLTGCFGLLSAIAEFVPTLEPIIQSSMKGSGIDAAPWDREDH